MCVGGSMTCVEKKFELQVRKWEYRGTRHSDGDSALVVELWLHRVADDLSGLTFQEPVEVRSLQLDSVVHGGRRTRGEAVRKVQGVGNRTFVISVEKLKQIQKKKCLGAPTTPEDQAICLFVGLLANHDVPLRL
jgi:hypothetical protein